MEDDIIDLLPAERQRIWVETDNASIQGIGLTDIATDTQDEEPLGGRGSFSEPSQVKMHAHSRVHHMSDREVRLMSSYESLDYDVPQNELYRRERMISDGDLKSRESIARWIIFALIGFFTGSLAFGLAKGVEFLSDLKFDMIKDRVHEGQLWTPFFMFLGTSVGFITISTYLVAFIEPVAGGSGIPEIKGYLNGTNYLRFLRLKTVVVKAIGVMFSVAGGLAIGKEGPLVHSGAVFAANFSHGTHLGKFKFTGRLKWWLHRFRNDRDKRDFVSGGAAAGVAAAFGSPVGGILFSLEEASSFWSIDLTWRVFLCSMLGTFALNLWKVISTGKDSFSGLISFGPPLQGTPYRLWETPFFLLLACFGGLMGGAFNHINEKICHWRRDRLGGRPLLRMAEAMTIGAITATLSFWAPYFLGSCRVIPAKDHATMDQLGVNFFSQYRCPPGQYNSMASMIFATWEISIRGFFHNTAVYDWEALIGFFIAIFFLAVITYGIAVPSGLFVPCILMGCAFGRLMGEGMRYLFPDDNVVAGTYALIGATAALGGVARMTISLTVILLETTNDVQFIMPIMIVLMVSKWVGDMFNISLYDLHVELKCMPFVEAAPSRNMYNLTAAEIMQTPVTIFHEIERAGDIVDTIDGCSHNGFPVVTSAAPHKYVGMILRNQLAVLIKKRAFGPRETAVTKVSMSDFSTSLSSKHKPFNRSDLHPDDVLQSLDLRPFMNPVPIAVQGQTPLSRVFVLFRSLGIRHLVVVNDSNEVIGIIARKEIMSSFDQDLF